ncbi:MAG: class I SAM-dependent methyltransferase, partial [Planctomycetota bacterium]
MPSAPRRCPVCEFPPRRAYRLRNRRFLLQCPRCRLAWWRWSSFDPAAFYDREYFASEHAAKGYANYASLAPAVRRTSMARLRRIEYILGDDKGATRSLLDVGCATGGFLAAAAERGWQARGVEVSAWAVARAREARLD